MGVFIKEKYMKVFPVSNETTCCNKINRQNNVRKIGIAAEPENKDTFENSKNISFRGDYGAAKGVLLGALTGAAIAAATVATGGLAAVVAAVGSTGTIVGGAAAGTHIGGIIGGFLSDD